MPHLPREIIHQILRALSSYGGQKLAPLAVINRHWQITTEYMLWRHLRITTADIDAFTALCQTRSRRQAVRHVIFDAEYFKCPAERGREIESAGDGEYVAEHGNFARDEETGGGTTQDDGFLEEHRCSEDHSSYRDARQSLSAFQAEHVRFFHDIRKIWNIIASWSDCMKLHSIQIIVDGFSMYEHLGYVFRDPNVVNVSLCAEDWFGHFPILPALPSVNTFTMIPKVNTDVDLWSVIAGCVVARSLPALRGINIQGDDRERRWPDVRKKCREMLTSSVLAKQLLNLPASLERVELWLTHNSINDQRVEPASFLAEGVDNFSTNIHHFLSRLPHLTEVYLNVNHISPSLFWPANADCTPLKPLWPSLRVLDIRTGFETAAGSYWMRGASDFPASKRHLHYYWDSGSPQDDNYGDAAPGTWLVRYFRIRPDPSLFDALATSIAQAISHMPKLAYLNLEFNAQHRGPNDGGLYEHFRTYQGWACYFRAGNSARFLSTCFRNEWPDPGPDWTDIERPRLEWVFMCPFREVQWRQSEEADALWRKMFPDVDLDLVTLDYMENKPFETWERRRDGKVICRSRWRVK
ncbi:hypothetical protein SVAN01_03314 [Stagonosporopsis vannaccii]|nr:hypothetical protein SVAN01_03314 [Stagonosporopsis vannaccii]